MYISAFIIRMRFGFYSHALTVHREVLLLIYRDYEHLKQMVFCFGQRAAPAPAPAALFWFY
jgi:hypothetical protein